MQSVASSLCDSKYSVYLLVTEHLMQIVIHLFLTKMLVTMTPYSWQQTENCITRELGENVAVKVLILVMASFRILTKSASFGERKMAVLSVKSFGA